MGLIGGCRVAIPVTGRSNTYRASKEPLAVRDLGGRPAQGGIEGVQVDASAGLWAVRRREDVVVGAVLEVSGQWHTVTSLKIVRRTWLEVATVVRVRRPQILSPVTVGGEVVTVGGEPVVAG